MTQSRRGEIAAAYNEWAETYDTDKNATRDLAAQVLRRADLTLAGRRVIEVGCGTGRNTEWLTTLSAGPRNGNRRAPASAGIPSQYRGLRQFSVVVWISTRRNGRMARFGCSPKGPTQAVIVALAAARQG
ncbi:MAG TPA: hypothetical protein VGJ66_24050 [Pyrinomonadaceae bacterium]|jgi:hypothetical protein